MVFSEQPMISATRLALIRVFRLIKVIALTRSHIKRVTVENSRYRLSLNLGPILVQVCLTDYPTTADLIEAECPAFEKSFNCRPMHRHKFSYGINRKANLGRCFFVCL